MSLLTSTTSFVGGAAFALSLIIGNGSPTHADEGVDRAMNQIKKMYPNMHVGSLSRLDIKEFYEVTTGDQVVYFSPDAGILFFGEMWNNQGVSLTEKKRREIYKRNLTSLNREESVTIGSGAKHTIEFLGVDCPFSREVNDYLETREDITRHIFFIPNEKLNPGSTYRSALVLGAKDRASMVHEIMGGAYDRMPSQKVSTEVLSVLEGNIDKARSLGVKGTPTVWVNGVLVEQADINRIASLLDEGGKEDVKSK